jgi:SAM-dependent methyltransferase
MSDNQPIDTPTVIVPPSIDTLSPLSKWLRTPLGQYLVESEMPFIDELVIDAFGYYALQLGLPDVDYLSHSRVMNRFVVAPEDYRDDGRQFVRAQLTQLPIAEQSIDLVVAPHALEFDDDPHGILREIHRVLMPEGRFVLIGFNPWSMWGLKRGLARGDTSPWSGQYVSLPKIKDWLTLLGFEVVAGQLSAYAPPIEQDKWRKRFNWLERLGDRWWPVAGGVYMLQAVKRVQAMRVVQPAWRDQRKARLQIAQAARRTPPHGLTRLARDFTVIK